MTTIVGVALSIGTAYLAQHYNNIMDLLQLVFGFVNAPLFATFLLGMFWKRDHRATAPSPGLLSRHRRGRAHARLHRGRRQGRMDRARCTSSLPPWRRISGSRSSPGRPVSW